MVGIASRREAGLERCGLTHMCISLWSLGISCRRWLVSPYVKKLVFRDAGVLMCVYLNRESTNIVSEVVS